MLEVKNLSLSYDGIHNILDGLDFKLAQNEIAIIGGPTGSGKSTLAHCITGFISSKPVSAMSGTITVDEESVLDAETSEVARNIALVQQDPESQICTLNVTDEIAFGPENYRMDDESIREAIQSSLEYVDARHLLERTTQALSGGERQRIVIASMLARKPNYLILDEPTSNIDPKGLHHLKQVLLNFRNEGMGILCIEHNVHQLQDIADRILMLKKGRLESTTHTEIPTPNFSNPLFFHNNDSNPLINAHDLSYSYQDIIALDNVSVSIYRGEIVALMGDNGSGKTTLISLISGLMAPDTGRIYLDGIPLDKMSTVELAKRISVVFQNPNHQIFERTVWKDQILAIDLLGLEEEEHIRRSEKLLREFDLCEKAEQNPFSLSYGQKRRLNVTSTSFYDSQVFLFDEPFIGQDVKGKEFIANQILDHQQEQRTSIISTHDMKFAMQCCTRIIFMQNGRILVDGTPRAVIEWLEENDEPYYVPEGRNR